MEKTNLSEHFNNDSLINFKIFFFNLCFIIYINYLFKLSWIQEMIKYQKVNYQDSIK